MKKILQNTFNRLRHWQKRAAIANDELHILPYRGYGTPERLHLSARVLEYRNIHPHIADGAWRNALKMYRRFESDEVPNCALRLQIAHHSCTLHTDQEGYANADIQLNVPLPLSPKRYWYDTHWTLQKTPNPQTTAATGEVFIPHGDIQYGLITDIDDTVLKTHVISKTKMLYYTFFKNAYSRLAFAGTAPLYWAWRKGDTGQRVNPIFYVSNSPSNLYDMLSDFMQHNDLPKGPICLRDIVLPTSEKIAAYKEHKYNTIVKILHTFPQWQFVLVGDSGERDADIYTEIAHIFPHRIKAIYIRSVADLARNERVRRVLEQCETCETLLFDDSLAAIQHSANIGLAQTRWIDAIAAQQQHQPKHAAWEDWIDTY